MIAALLTETADTQRQQFAGGKRTGFAAHLSDLSCSPPYPASPSRTAALLVDADSRRKASVYECFLAGRPDIQNGDRLTTGGVTYLVQSAGYWQDVTKVVLEREQTVDDL